MSTTFDRDEIVSALANAESITSTLTLWLEHRPGLVLAYGRISRDVTAQKLGVTRQLSDCDGYASERGVHIDQEFSDNDISGWSGKNRPDYSEMMRLVASGVVSIVIAWHLDRLTRNPLEFEQMMALFRQHKVKLVTVTAGDLDPTSPDGMLLARMTGAVAAYESDHKSRRITRKHQDMAERGEFHGGRRRFGYHSGFKGVVIGPRGEKPEGCEDCTTAVHEPEAVIIRELAQRLLAGETLHSLATWLNEQHVPTPGGGKAWTGSNLGLMMTRPHLAGLRVHGKDEHNKPVVIGEASWPAILDRATHESVKHLLSDPKRRTSFSNARVYLLAGLATCAECGLPLRGRTNHQPSSSVTYRAYICSSTRHVHRNAQDVDDLVTPRVIARLEQSDSSGCLVDDEAADLVATLTTRATELRQKLDDLADEFADEDLSPAMLAKMSRALETKLAKVESDLETARTNLRRPEIALDGMTGPNAASAWKSASLARKRAVLDLLYESIELRSSNRNARKGLTEGDVIMTPRVFG